MSDITPEYVEAMRQRDSRLRVISEASDVTEELRNSACVRYLLRQITTDADNAMIELSELSPLDSENVAKSLVKIRTLVYIRRKLGELQQTAALHAQQIHAEDMMGIDVGQD